MLISGIFGTLVSTLVAGAFLSIFMGASSNFTVSISAEYWNRSDLIKHLNALPAAQTDRTLSSYSDAGSIASWASDAMKLFVEAGVINGNGGKLDPISKTSRAEFAQVLYNLMA